MGNDQQPNAEIPPKIKKAVNIFHSKLSKIEDAKERRQLIIKCDASDDFKSKFNLSQWIHVAKYVLANDKIIAEMRQKIVPSLIKENEFWLRYFYCIKEEKKKTKKKKKSSTKQKPKADKIIDEIEEESYQVLLHKPEIWLYKISGSIWRGRNNKCELWSLRNPLWSGRLRIVAFNHGAHLEFQFLDKEGGIYLKSTRIKLDELSGDDIHTVFDAYGVIDSSRYFIVWIDVPSKTKSDHRIPFGFGIRERQDAFDIRACVADQMKIIRRDKEQSQSEENKIESGDNDGYDVLDQDVGGGAESGKKNMFTLDDDEMIEIGHDIDNIDHQTDDALQKHQNSVILKVDKEEFEKNDSFSLPALTPPPENEEVVNEKEVVDDDFGEFQTPNDEEPDVDEQNEKIKESEK